MGRIAYYDRAEKLVWIVWEKQKGMRNSMSASGVPVEEITKIKGYQITPWWPRVIRMRAAKAAHARRNRNEPFPQTLLE